MSLDGKVDPNRPDWTGLATSGLVFLPTDCFLFSQRSCFAPLREANVAGVDGAKIVWTGLDLEAL